MTKKAEIIVALDFPDKNQALSMIDELDGACDFFKIGMELGLRVDDEFIKSLIARGKKIFLDYKYHDIGNTVEKAVANAAELGVYMLTVHAEKQVLEAAVKGAKSTNTKVFGVTVLTSLDEDYATQYGCSIKDLVLRRAAWAHDLGADGVIASPHEAAIIKTQFPALKVCTPGIRPAGADSQDQKRVTTPADAIKAGADYLVIGRPITQAENPRQAALQIIDDSSQ
ncbi:MAG: orotidine-5'-phosphate decarboxylase [Alphaproteobacteria bacterium CG11_big_fil_rev_8_21_14_0_20_44_7]|nr:MAG: orotidine-5'-phosphate decarboxylase [Alphaproteobacteria bacterium CG11_big_fil_rev_8_21_14_0_20_44_7]